MDMTFPGYPAASGHPQLHGTYIPNLFAKKLLVFFYMTTVLAAISNTEYEGMIKGLGDQITIRTLPEIAIHDYVKGQDLEYEQLEPSSVDLLIDKGKYWGFPINDVDRAQADLDYVGRWAEHAAQLLKIKVDALVLADIWSDVAAENTGGTAGKVSGNINLGAANARALSGSNTAVIDFIIECGQVLDEQNVPETGRFMTIPAWMNALIKKSELRDASVSGDGISMARNGRLGMIDRFTLYNSNQLATSTDGAGASGTHIVFGTKHALTFASQMVKTETLRNTKDFGDLVRGLQVFGYKVVKPDALGHAYVKA